MTYDIPAISLLLGSFVVLLLIRVPISFTLGISAIITAIYLKLPLLIIAQRIVNGMESINLIAIPFFILAGAIMSEGKIAERLVNFAGLFVGRIRGGYAMVNCVASMFFGGVSGSAVADVSSIGALMIPAMEKKGYRKDFTVALITTSAVCAVLIPPSHNMIIYSLAAGGVSVGKLLLGGLIPGIMLGLSLMVLSYIMAVKYKFPKEPVIPGKQKWIFFRDGLLSILLAVIIMGGIASGIFTAAESAAVAVVYAFILTFIIYRDEPLRALGGMLRNAVVIVAMVFLLIATSNAFGWILTYLGVPGAIAQFMLSISHNKYVILTLINVFLLILGCLMDMAPAIVITTPILLPIVTQVGVNPIHFGVIMVFNLGIGLCTPPVGNAMFVGCAVGKTTIEKIFKMLMLCYIPMVIVLFLVTFLPDLVMWLPNLVIK
jgi:tripartite ATP-independent transporter DctM subunit